MEHKENIFTFRVHILLRIVHLRTYGMLPMGYFILIQTSFLVPLFWNDKIHLMQYYINYFENEGNFALMKKLCGTRKTNLKESALCKHCMT